MANYDNSLHDKRGAYPENAVDAHEWSLFEPLLTPKQLTRRFLWGVDLVSNSINRMTGKPDRMEDEDLRDMILRSVGRIQMETKIDIFPVKRSEKKPFDRAEMIDLGRLLANFRPILSVDKLSVAPGNSPDIMVIAPDWLASDGYARGEIRIIPTWGSIASGYVPASDSVGNGAAFVSIMGGRAWVPSFWTLEYTTGFADGRIPKPLNDLIGCYSAIEALSMLATTNRANSTSIGMDGMSKSSSNAGTQIYDPRINLLKEQKTELLKKFRAAYGNKFAMGNI